MPTDAMVDRGYANFRDSPEDELRRTPLRNCLKSPGSARTGASRGSRWTLFGAEHRLNPRSEAYSNPFSDSFKAKLAECLLWGVWRMEVAPYYYYSWAKASRNFFSCSSDRLVEMISKS